MATITIGSAAPVTVSADTNVSALLSPTTVLSGTVQVDATNMTAIQLNAVSQYISKVAANGITGVMALSNSQSSVELTNLFSKYAGTTATVNTTDMPAASLTVLVTNKLKIANIPTAGTEIYTDTQFAALGSKLVDAETVKVDASAATAAELAAMLTDSTNISEITGTAIGIMTAAQFEGLGDKLATAVVDAKVNAANATLAQSAKMVENVSNIAAGGITGTLATMKPADFTTLSNLSGTSKLATTATAKIEVTVANAASEADVAAMVTKVANIAANTAGGISVASDATLSMRDDQFVTLGGKLSDVANSVATATVVASDANATEVAAMVTNASNIRSITGTFATTGMDEVQFRSLGAKLADGDSPVTVAVNASSAIASDIAIMADNASNISAITGTLIGAMTDEQFAVLGGKLANAVTDAKVIATTPDSTAVGVIVENASNIAALGITGSGIALDETQFQTLAPKFATTVTGITIDATGADATIFKPLFITHAAKIAAGGITGISGLALTDSEFTTLGAKLGNAAGDVPAVIATVDATGVTATEAAAMEANADNISTISITGSTAITLTSPQFTALAGKFANNLSNIVKVTATVTGQAGADHVTAMADHAGLIPNLGITGSGFATGYSQFVTLKDKFAAAVTGITIDGTSAPEVSPVLLSTHAAKIAVGGISNMTGLAVDEVQFTTLAPKFDSAGNDAITDVTVDATGATAAHVTALVADADNIATTGITHFTTAVTDTQFNALAAKLATNTTGIAVDATAATATEVATMATNAGYISSITGTGIVMAAPAQFTALGSKLADAIVDVKVTATGAVASDVAALVSDAANIATGGITIAGTDVSVTDGQFVTLGAKLSDVLVNTLPSRVKVVASDANATEIAAMVTNAPNIVNEGISGTFAASVTKAQFVTLGAKLANAVLDDSNVEGDQSVPAVSVNVNATGAISAAEMTAMVANADNINNGGASVGITGIASTAAAFTKTQFNALGNKLADGITVGVDLASTEGSAPAVADVVNVMANNVANIKDLGITASGVTLSLSDTQFAALSNSTVDKFAAAITNISVDATSATSTEIAAMIAKTAHIGTVTGSAATLNVGQFASLASKLNITDVTVDTTGATAATAAQITALTGNADKIDIITGSDLSLTSASFVTLASKFSEAENTAPEDDVDATAHITVVSSPENIPTLVENVNHISDIAGTGLAMNLSQFLALGDKLADNATTVNGTNATGSDISFIIANVDNIASSGLSNTSGWTQVLSATDFLTLQPKLANGTTVNVVLTGENSETIANVLAHSTFIANGGLSGTGLTLTAAQFAANVSKLASGVTVTVDATGATSANLDAMVSSASKISTSGIIVAAADSAASPPVPETVFNAAQFSALHSKLASGDTVIVDSTGASSTQITLLNTNEAKISALAGTPAATLTIAQFDTFADSIPANGKLYVNQSEGEFVDPIPSALLNVNAASATSDQKLLMAANADSIHTITGSGLTFTADEFAALGLKLGVSVSVDATDMSPEVIKTVLLPALAISKVSSITGDLVINAAALDTEADSTADQAINLGKIFPKYTGTSAVVDATGFDVAAVNKLNTGTYLPKIAAINGTLEFTSANTATAITDLLAKDTAETDDGTSTPDNVLDDANDIIHATSMNESQITAVALGLNKIAEIRGAMRLTSAHANVDDDANSSTAAVSKLDALLTKSVMPATAEDAVIIVDATDMTATDLAVIATHNDKIASITLGMNLDSSLTVGQLTDLFSKDDEFANDNVVATGMETVADGETSSPLDVVLGHLSKIGSITGQLALSNEYVDSNPSETAIQLDATDTFAKVFDMYDGTEITVDVDGMLPAALNKIAEGINASASTTDKVASITGVMALTALNDPDVLAALLSTDATDATVVATGMQSESLNVLADAIAADSTKVAAGGISGDMELAGQDDVQLTDLFSKYSGSTATVDTSGMNSTALDVLVTNADAISSIIAAGGETYTDTQFATLGAKMADGVSLVSVNVDATEASADEVAAMVTNKENVATIVVSAPDSSATPPITPTVFTATQFKDLAEKLNDGSVVTVSTSGETDGTEIGVMLEQIDNIGNITVTADFLNLTVADLALLAKLDDTTPGSEAKADVNLNGADEAAIALLVANPENVNAITNTDTEVLLTAADFTVLGSKFVAESMVKVDASAASTDADIPAMILDKDNIGLITASTDLAVAAFTELGSKLADDVVVSVDASNGSTDVDVPAMMTDATNISAITGTTLPDLTDAQFAVLGSKLAVGVVVNINVEGASTADNIAAMAADSVNIDGIFGTDVLMSATDFTTLGTLLDDTATAVVDITGAVANDITAMVTDVANISDIIGDGSSIAAPLTAAEFKVLGIKLHDEDGNEGTEDPTVLVSIATTSLEVELIEMVNDADNIAAEGISGITALTLTDAEFTALGSKLADATIEITVNATDADATDVAAMLADVDNIIDGSNTPDDNTDDGVGITGVSDLHLTAQEFAILGVKLADSVTDVTVDATIATVDEFTAMIDDVGNINALGITVAAPVDSALPPIMTAAQFLVLGSKLADNSQVRIDATGATATQIAALVTDAANIVDGSIVGLETSELNAEEFAALATKIADPALIIDATGMNSTALAGLVEALFDEEANTGSVRYITGALAITEPTELVLLQNYFETPNSAMSNVTVDMTNITTSEDYGVVIANINNGNITKLTGTLVLSFAQTEGDLAALLGVYAGSTATVDVDTVDGDITSTMSPEQLQIIAKHIDAVDTASITGAMALTADLSADDLTDLFSKDDATADAVVNATNMKTAQLAVIATNATNIAANGIDGALVVGSLDATDATLLTALFGKVGAENVTVNTAHMNADELTAVATNIDVIDTLAMTRAKGITVAAADVTGATLELLGGVLTINGTADVDTIDLSGFTGKAGTLIEGLAGADAITLNDATADVVVLSSTDTAADTISNFHVNNVGGARDKISVDAEPTLGGVAPLSIRLNRADVEINAGLTKVATNAVDTQAEGVEGYGILDAADIYAALTGGDFDLKLPTTVAEADIYYIAIDNGINAAIARIDASTSPDAVIDEAEITVVGVLEGVSNVAALSATGNFTGFGTLV